MQANRSGKIDDLEATMARLLRGPVGLLLLALALGSLGLGAGLAAAPDLERSNRASALRWVMRGDSYEAGRAETAATTMTNRYKALAAAFGARSTLSRADAADTSRWVKMGETYAASGAEAAATAMTLRYQALAAAFGARSTPSRADAADTARWVMLGKAYEAARAEATTTAMANRFRALAAYYGMEPAALASSFDADTSRWFRLGEAYAAKRAQAAATAMTDRYEATANRFRALAAYYGMEPATLASSFDADTSRWFRLGEAYAAKRAEAAATAMTDRYEALAEYCNGQPASAPTLLCRADSVQSGR